jgi:hypothetical protein
MRTGGVDVEIHDFLPSALVGGAQVHAPTTYALRKSPIYPLDTRQKGPQKRSNRREITDKSLNLPGLELRHLVTSSYTKWAISAPTGHEFSLRTQFLINGSGTGSTHPREYN